MQEIEKHILVSRLNTGEPGALREVYELLGPGLRLYLRRFTTQAADIDALVSDILFKLWQHRGKYPGWEQLRAYLHVVARHTAIDFAKKQQALGRRYILPPELPEIAEEGPREISAEAEILLLRIHDAIAHLPRKQRRVVELLYLEGLDVAEVAERLRISEKTVLNQKYRAQQRLRFLFGGREMVWTGLILGPLTWVLMQ